MNYHNITTDDMLNGDGLRVVLWVSGCEHHCKGCQNPQTWDTGSGIFFDSDAFKELCYKLNHDYISGLTISGGDPFHPSNVLTVGRICWKVKGIFPNKSIWIYTGYTWEQIKHYESLLHNIDVLVDGEFIEELSSIEYHWAGSTNQRIIDVQKSLKEGKVILWEK